jgi:hypothetical protein
MPLAAIHFTSSRREGCMVPPSGQTAGGTDAGINYRQAPR